MRSAASYILQSAAALTMLAGERLASAAETDSKPRSYRVITLKGRSFKLQIEQKNSLPLEVKYFIEDQIVGLPPLRSELLIGRDLDMDGKFDIWFYSTAPGSMEVIEKNSSDADGWDAAKDIIEKDIDILHRNPWPGYVRSALLSLTITGNSQKNFMQDLEKRIIRLHERETLALRLLKKDPKNKLARSALVLVSESWQAIIKETESGFITHSAMVAGDMLVTGAFGAASQYAVQVGGVAWAAFAAKLPAPFTAQLGKVIQTISTNVARVSSNAMTRVGAVLAKGPAAIAPAALGQAIKSKAAADLLFKGIQQRLALDKIMASQVGVIGQKLVQNAGYIMLQSGLQVGVESTVRAQELAATESDPYLVATKVAKDKDMWRNVLFSTNESVLQSSIGESIQGSLRKRFAICGFMSVVDSATVGAALNNGEVNPYRSFFDTTWQATVGNMQTWFDLRALEYFTKKAASVSNPKLKLIGWAVVVSEQLLGFYAYNRSTDKLFDKPHEKAHPDHNKYFAQLEAEMLAELSYLPVFTEVEQ